MSSLVAAPVLLPLATALVCLALREHPRAARAASLAGAFLLLLSTTLLLLHVQAQGILALRVGDWPAPYGIVLVADLFGAIMALLAAIIGLASLVYAAGSMSDLDERLGFHPLVHVLLAGVCGAFLTGDLFNLYVWFEVLLIASFVLLALGGDRARYAGAIQYVALNLLASALFLAAVGLLYARAGTLNFADLVVKAPALAGPELTAIALLFAVAFGIKAAVFPLFSWLPASYPAAHPAVAALFAGLLTKVGVYAIVRLFSMVFVHDVAATHAFLLGVAGATMVTGVLGAAAQRDFRHILSFHIVSQIGYMVLGLALFTPLAVAGAIFYIGHHILVKTNLFFVGGIVERIRGTGDLGRLGGLAVSHPFLAFLFLVPALSLAGVPPLSGFWAKLSLVRAGLEIEQWLLVAVALTVGFLTLYSMMKIWNEVFWRPPKDDAPDARAAWTLYVPVVGLATLTLSVGLAAGPLFALATEAATQLLEPDAYVRAVLGVPP
ncbi:MAG TPA: Na+/H+ antiporter subunit D [Candidatus Thermoplasmatota archaeon]|nr:Na+/H+ antiporter subunit D [Candidatus Thermoplasmatota archaeon]